MFPLDTFVQYLRHELLTTLGVWNGVFEMTLARRGPIVAEKIRDCH